jgi:hypothetical protein
MGFLSGYFPTPKKLAHQRGQLVHVAQPSSANAIQVISTGPMLFIVRRLGSVPVLFPVNVLKDSAGARRDRSDVWRT